MAVRAQSLPLRPERRARALADPTRIALLELLTEQPRPVSDLAHYLGVPPDRLYHHLDVLEESGLVRLRQIRPRRLYEAVPESRLDSQCLSDTDRLELIAAVFDLARTNAEAAHRRSEALHVAAYSVLLNPRDLEALTAEVSEVIERWSQRPRGRRARRTRIIFGAIPLASEPAEPK